MDTAEQSDGGSKQGLHIMALKVEGRWAGRFAISA